jgi:hypothetical protein
MALLPKHCTRWSSIAIDYLAMEHISASLTISSIVQIWSVNLAAIAGIIG